MDEKYATFDKAWFKLEPLQAKSKDDGDLWVEGKTVGDFQPKDAEDMAKVEAEKSDNMKEELMK